MRIAAAVLVALIWLVGPCRAAELLSLPRFDCDSSPLLVRNVDLWSAEGIERRRDVLIVDGKFSRIAAHGRVDAPKGTRVLEGRLAKRAAKGQPIGHERRGGSSRSGG